MLSRTFNAVKNTPIYPQLVPFPFHRLSYRELQSSSSGVMNMIINQIGHKGQSSKWTGMDCSHQTKH